MGIVFRQSIKGSIAIFGGILLGGIYIYFTAHAINKTELGGIRNLLSQAAVIQIFFLAGAANLMNPYILQFKENDPKRQVLLTISIALPLLVALVFSGPYLVFKDLIIQKYQAKDREFVRSFYSLLLPLSVFMSYMTLFEYYLNSQLKAAITLFLREVALRLGLLLMLSLYALQILNLKNFVIGTVFMHAVPLGIMIYYARKTRGFGLSTNWKVFSKKEYSQITHYAFFHLLTSGILNLMGYVDAIMLAPLSVAGLDDVAVYQNALFLISIMLAPYRAMATAAFPKLAEAFLAGAHEHLQNLFNRSGLNMLIVAVAMWLIVVCNLHNAVALFPPGYAAMAPIVMILSIGRIIDMGTGLNTELISVTLYYKFNFRLALVLLISVILLDRIFIPRYGIYGAAWVATTVAAIANLIKMVFLYKREGLHPFSRNSMQVIAIGALSYGLSLILPRMAHPILDAIYRSGIIIIVYGTLLLVSKSSADLQEYYQQILKNKRLF